MENPGRASLEIRSKSQGSYGLGWAALEQEGDFWKMSSKEILHVNKHFQICNKSQSRRQLMLAVLEQKEHILEKEQ